MSDNVAVPAHTSNSSSSRNEPSSSDRLRRLAIEHPGDFVAVAALTVVAVLTILDLLELVNVPAKVLGNGALLVGSALAIQLTVRHARNKEQASTMNNLHREVKTLNGRLTARLGEGGVIEIPSTDIGKRLEAQLGTTKFWYFRGGSGRWQRSDALPTLARVTSADVEYVMQILTPLDESLCRRYAQYRFKQRDAVTRRPNEGSPSTVRDELLACIYAAGWYSARTRIKARVYLMPLYSPTRIDAGTDSLVASVADSTAPALLAPANGWYYEALLDEIRQAMGEVPEIVLPPHDESLYPSDWKSISGSHVQATLSATRLRGLDGATRNFKYQSWGTVDHDVVAKLAFLDRKE